MSNNILFGPFPENPLEIFDIFMLQYQKIIWSAKNVTKESSRGLQYC